MGSERESQSDAASPSRLLYRERLDAGVTGHGPAKEKLAEVVQQFTARGRPGHVLILGPPGAGKGTLGRALMGAVAPLPSVFIEHADELTRSFGQAVPSSTLFFVKNIDHLCRDPKKLEAWLAQATKVGSLVVASAALSVTAVGLELVFDQVVELEALTKREIEGAMLQPAGLVMQVIGQCAKRGLTITMLPEAKRMIADAAASSGRGMNFMREFSAGLLRVLPAEQRGDYLMDRATIDAVLRELG